MKTTRTIASTQRWRRSAPSPLVLVPTMGALHAGHTKLMDVARRLAGKKGQVAVSIFVNPTQFGPKEDFSRYPRPFSTDLALCEKHGVDLVFHPDAGEIYEEGFSTYVEETTVSGRLCGASRPGHFRGVCTVVLKLFQIVRPDAAVFGLKDFQQCAVIQRMVRDLNLGVKIVPVPTVREADGLALSSRNRYLSAEERVQAPVLQKALRAAESAWRQGEESPARLRRLITQTLKKASLARIDYVEIADASTLQPTKKVGRNSVIALAVFFGTTRLIDNVWLK